MKKLVLLVVALTLMSGLVAIANAADPGYCVNRPTYTQGDYWVWERPDGSRVKREFVGPENEALRFENKERGHIYYVSLDLVDLKVTDKDGKILWKRTWPPEAAHISFPLCVGKEWNHSWQAFKDARLEDFILTVKVAALEEVTVKAGRFRAFRIEWEVVGLRCKCRDQYIYWYAPMIRSFAKFQEPNPKNSRELVEFNVQSPKETPAPLAEAPR